MDKNTVYFIGLGTFLWLVTVGITVFFTQVFSPKIVEFNLEKTVGKFQSDIAHKDLSEAQSSKTVARFTTALDTALIEYAKDNNVIILVSPAIISGAADVTQPIQKKVLNSLKASQSSEKASVYNE